jgi:methyltransferase (TIGR00027 family)
MDKLQVFEVDHPATQVEKLKRLRRISPEIPANLHMIPVDFSRDDLKTALIKAGYRLEKPGFFSWLGVTYYLDRSAVQSTLQTLANIAVSGCELVFDYKNEEAFQPKKNPSSSEIIQTITRRSGEPMKTGFNPAKLEEELKQYGFQTIENLSPQEIESRYFANRNDLYHAAEYVHIIHGING